MASFAETLVVPHTPVRLHAVIGSIAVHALLGVLFAVLHPRAAPTERSGGALAIEVIEVPPPPSPEPVKVASRAPGTTRRAGAPRRAIGLRRAEVRDVDPRGEITIERGGGPSGEGGAGDGRGEGWGDGLGRGAAGSHEMPVVPPVIAHVPRVSKARPARLVYPRRNRDVDDGETFVARVTIDADGYVVGARLVRGFGGRRDEEAAGLIFKFRYAPALDEEGRPVRSTLDQNFLVE